MIRWSMRWALVLGVLSGSLIGFIDSRPGWDDTGITAAALFIVAAFLSSRRPEDAILIGLSVGVPVLVLNALQQHGPGAVLAVVIAMAGAGSGWALGKLSAAGSAS